MMNRKKIIPLIIMIAAAGVFYYYQTAKVARKESDKLLDEFKKTDESLKRLNDSLNSKLADTVLLK
jgi:Skp family chaperone for outer membrane proteins